MRNLVLSVKAAKQLDGIFDYRWKKLEQLFGSISENKVHETTAA